MLLDLPVTFDLEAAMSGARVPVPWNPEYGARVGLLPRDGDAGERRGGARSTSASSSTR